MRSACCVRGRVVFIWVVVRFRGLVVFVCVHVVSSIQSSFVFVCVLCLFVRDATGGSDIGRS